MNTRSRFSSAAAIVILAFLWAQITSLWSDEGNSGKKHLFSQLLDEVNQKGQKFFDIEQGQFSPEFENIDLGARPNYLDALTDILASQNWAYEMRGDVMVLYDKKLRASGDQDFLNRKIKHIKLSDVNREQCFQAIAKEMGITIFGGAPLIDEGHEKPTPNFNIELNEISLRDALFLIAFQSHHKIWNAATTYIGDKMVLLVSVTG